MSQSDLKVLEVLEYLYRRAEPTSVTTLMTELGLSRATAYRLVSDLEREGWVKLTKPPVRIMPSMRAFLLAGAVLKNDRLRYALFPNAVDVARQTRLPVNTCYYDDGYILLSDVIEFYADRLVAIPFAQRVPALTFAPGRAVLAFKPHAEVDRLISEGIVDYEVWPNATSGTTRPVGARVVDPEELRAEIDLAARQGFAKGENEPLVDFWHIAVPVFDQSEDAVGAIAVANRVPMPDDIEDRILPVLRRAAERASLDLGYRGRLHSLTSAFGPPEAMGSRGETGQEAVRARR